MAKKLIKSDIKRFKEKLEEEKNTVYNQIEELKKNDPFNDPDHASDNAAVDTDVREQVGHDTVQAQIKVLQKRLKHIDLALGKISKGKYGYCERCDMQIPLKRLELIPEARYCIDCERQLFK